MAVLDQIVNGAALQASTNPTSDATEQANHAAAPQAYLGSNWPPAMDLFLAIAAFVVLVVGLHYLDDWRKGRKKG